MRLKWMKCRAGDWCTLNHVDLDNEHFHDLHGVYIIWHGGANPAVVYVGQGYISARLRAHRSDPSIQRFAKHGLYVSWSPVHPDTRDGVEAYLAYKWNPRIGRQYPSTTPVEVNAPWD